MARNEVSFRPFFPLDIEGVPPPLRVSAGMTAGLPECTLRHNALSLLCEDVPGDAGGGGFARRVLDQLGITAEVDGECLKRVPASGPLVVVCNHPFGLIQGLLLAELLHGARADVRLLVNHLPARVPDGRDRRVPVNPLEGQEVAPWCIGELRDAVRWLRQGGVLVTFPAGEFFRPDPGAGHVRDGSWNETVAGIIRATYASALPVHMDDAGRVLFHAGGLLHHRLGTEMLLREPANRQDRAIPVTVGRVIPPPE